MKIDNNISTPYYLIDEKLLIKNLEILQKVKRATGCKILLAQKAFSCFYFYPLIKRYLDGTASSGLFEARLGYEKMGAESHVFSPGYREDEFEEILKYSDHVVFNSFAQVNKFLPSVLKAGKEAGIRINPEHSTQNHAIYDPCAPLSRMGVKSCDFDDDKLNGISGFHFHTLCEQNSDALETTLAEVEKKFSRYFNRIKWVNFGGGHHITREDYDVEKLINLINTFRKKYGLTVYLEPGEAVVLNSGFLVSSVLDIVKNGKDIAILDTSAACHMPDVLEVPYTPRAIGADKNGKHHYRLSSNTCLAGDIIGDYSFNKPLEIGSKIIFEDMALYTMVKNNTFNGINLPSIAVRKADGSVEVIKSFGYKDFEGRLS